MALYHYTCDHCINSIRADGYLRPGPDGLVWLTDLDPPHRTALGLTSHLLDCDRLAHRVVVPHTNTIIHWPTFRRVNRGWRAELESAQGAMPMHWWVSSEPVPILAAT